ncbi:MAG: DNA polymerase III subunit beta [Beggiatoa sp. IS2]|nr:MAG: DNA polymerase III subunit beta [Beggiatoa sp. IS2]
MVQTNKTPEAIIQLLKTFKERYQTEYQLKSLGIFGSYARHQMSAASDIDIFFETDAPNLLKTAHLREELETLLELPVDLVRLRNDMNPRLKSRIERDAWYV